MRFQNGDIVKTSSHLKLLSSKFHYGRGTVTSTEGRINSEYPIHVDWEDVCDYDLYKESELKLVRRPE